MYLIKKKKNNKKQYVFKDEREREGESACVVGEIWIQTLSYSTVKEINK